MTDTRRVFNGRAVPTVWRLSAKWARHKLDCTASGFARCQGKCCHAPGKASWPSGSGARYGKTYCMRLTLGVGCQFEEHDKPLICLLYPFVLSKTGLLGLHYRALSPSFPCHVNKGKGPAVVEAMRSNLSAVFGAATVERMIVNTREEHDTNIVVKPVTLGAYAREQGESDELALPYQRSDFVTIDTVRGYAILEAHNSEKQLELTV